jgi:DtxR family Mn-dependent transcriptional regulator
MFYLADALKISRASVTKMLQKLSATKPPLLIYEKHHGVRVAEAGAERTLEIVRHHRLIETFLHQVLGYAWDEVHDEAERLEHFISERFEESIAAKLNDPNSILTDIPSRTSMGPFLHLDLKRSHR